MSTISLPILSADDLGTPEAPFHFSPESMHPFGESPIAPFLAVIEGDGGVEPALLAKAAAMFAESYESQENHEPRLSRAKNAAIQTAAETFALVLGVVLLPEAGPLPAAPGPIAQTYTFAVMRALRESVLLESALAAE